MEYVGITTKRGHRSHTFKFVARDLDGNIKPLNADGLRTGWGFHDKDGTYFSIVSSHPWQDWTAYRGTTSDDELIDECKKVMFSKANL